MSIETRTTLDQRELRPDGTILLRFAKQVIRDGNVVTTEWHRTSLSPGSDIAATIAAVNRDLSRLGFADVSGEDVSRIQATAASEWTPEVVSEFTANNPKAAAE